MIPASFTVTLLYTLYFGFSRALSRMEHFTKEIMSSRTDGGVASATQHLPLAPQHDSHHRQVHQASSPTLPMSPIPHTPPSYTAVNRPMTYAATFVGRPPPPLGTLTSPHATNASRHLVSSPPPPVTPSGGFFHPVMSIQSVYSSPSPTYAGVLVNSPQNYMDETNRYARYARQLPATTPNEEFHVIPPHCITK